MSNQGKAREATTLQQCHNNPEVTLVASYYNVYTSSLTGAGGTTETDPRFQDRKLGRTNIAKKDGDVAVVWDEDEDDLTSDDERGSHRILQLAHERRQQAQHRQVLDSTMTGVDGLDDSDAWDRFYQTHQRNFFKDRHYLPKEFPNEFGVLKNQGRRRTWFEIGCGVGNAFLPLLEESNNVEDDEDDDAWIVHAMDVSSVAINLLRQEERFCHASQTDQAFAYCGSITHAQLFPTILPMDLIKSFHVVTMFFCLSAIPPQHHKVAVQNAIQLLDDHGGVLIVRDYGWLDQAQLQLARQPHSFVESSYYRKHDGTCCYYFTTQELRHLFVEYGGLQTLELKYVRKSYRNRSTNQVRRRVWVQARFTKPSDSTG